MKNTYLEHAAAWAATHPSRGYSFARPKAATDTRVQWIAAHKPAYEWLLNARSTGSTFAASLLGYLERNGTLSPGQLAAVEDNLTRESQIPANVSGEGFSLLMRAFQHARSSGLKYPKVHVGSLRFTLAQEDSKNPGYIYIRADGHYAGKISPTGEFSPAYETTTAQKERITTVARDPLAAAVAHGHETGNCAICSRHLSDPDSVTRGIGPVCAKKFGWMS